MSGEMQAVRALMAPWPSVFSTEETTRLAVAAPRVDADVPLSLRARCDVTTRVAAGRTVVTLVPKWARAEVTVIYLHGGAYVFPMLSVHWTMIEQLLMRTGAAVVVPLYGLAPEATVDDALTLVDDVRDHVDDGHRLVLAGDSAGGGLALAEAIRARNYGRRAADQLILLAPWVDVTYANPETAALERTGRDTMLKRAGSRMAGRWWAGGRSVDDPLVSPLRDDLRDLPPMAVYQGAHDLLTPDVRTLVTKARAAGTTVHYVEEPDGFHVYPAAWWTPEARDMYSDAAARISGRLPRP